METLKFKTNINCSGCVAKVTQKLNEVAGEGNWSVDIKNPKKTLTVLNGETTVEQVADAVKEAGFKAEVIGNAS